MFQTASRVEFAKETPQDMVVLLAKDAVRPDSLRLCHSLAVFATVESVDATHSGVAPGIHCVVVPICREFGMSVGDVASVQGRDKYGFCISQQNFDCETMRLKNSGLSK